MTAERAFSGDRPMRRAVFLDRDGVLNRAVVRAGRPHPPRRVDEVERLPGVEESCRRLAAQGWALIVVTNQPDVARGTATAEEVAAINGTVVADLPVTDVLVCLHDDADRCACRKPLPGLLHEAAERWDIDLSSSVMVGDRWRDVAAGQAAGVETFFIDHGYDEPRPTAPDHVVTDLAAVADLLLTGRWSRTSSVDDWEAHWTQYADTASANPAQAYRRELVVSAIDRAGPPHRLLDVGSGQGDLLATFAGRWPGADLAGLDLSGEGIRQARAKVPSARFFQIDLMASTPLPQELVGWADVAVCSEVLEHVDDPVQLLRSAAGALAPGALVVITVPGGPRTAFDRLIGHRRHYTPAALRSVLVDAGFTIEEVRGTGFPFFNLYKLVVLVGGRSVAREAGSGSPPSWLARAAMGVFEKVLTPRWCSRRRGWQIVGVARRA